MDKPTDVNWNMSIVGAIVLIVIAVGVGAILIYKPAPKALETQKTMDNTQPTNNVPAQVLDKKTATAQDGDLVSVKYTGKLPNGTVFDSTEKHGGTPIQFVLGASMVIKGWDEGIVGMKIGDKKVLDIPAEKAYGAQGIPDGAGGYIIPPNSKLIFDVELVDIQRK